MVWPKKLAAEPVSVRAGAALKPQVGYMVAQLLGLKSAPQPADAADGVVATGRQSEAQ